MITDETPIPFGSKKGTKMKDLSDGYLTTLYDAQKKKLSKAMREYIENRIPILKLGKP